MAVTTTTKSRVGFAIALIVILVIGWRQVLTQMSISVRLGYLISGGLALLGMLSWLGGKLIAAGRARAESSVERVGVPDPANGHSESESPPVSGWSQFWGVILVTTAGVSCLMAEWSHRTPRVAFAPPPPEASAREIQPAPVVFPSLELRGMIESGNRSTAIINGKTLRIGDQISGVRLTAVSREGVTVELAGQSKVLTLARLAGRLSP
jgi:hypothetical protein